MQPETARLAELCARVARRHPYQREPWGMDDWRTPRQVQIEGGGDCEDAALGVLLKLARDEWPVEPRYLVCGTYRGAGHAWARIGGFWADPTFDGSGRVSASLWRGYEAAVFFAHGPDLRLGQAYKEEKPA